MQQASTVADNLIRADRGQTPRPFSYRNLGTMATIGRKKAVAEIGRLKFGGLSAWMLWLIVHLRSILGVKNKTAVFLNWVWKDRKSTRLNSSHANISYAVFCLKKK